jgi:2-oxoglutarate dehydrogenase E1 component
MSAPDWYPTSPLYAGNAAYLEQFGDDAGALADAAAAGRGAASDAAQVAVLRLINAYRYLGVRKAELDPLRRFEPPPTPELDPEHYGLTEADMSREFETGSLFGVASAPRWPTSCSACARVLRACRRRVHAHHRSRAQALAAGAHRVGAGADRDFRPPEKKLLKRLTDAETLEKFLHTRHVGQKRFSLEGPRA